MDEELLDAFIDTEWLWSRSYEDYEPSPYDGTYTEA